VKFYDELVPRFPEFSRGREAGSPWASRIVRDDRHVVMAVQRPRAAVYYPWFQDTSDYITPLQQPFQSQSPFGE
jgi:hypothetical protein